MLKNLTPSFHTDRPTEYGLQVPTMADHLSTYHLIQSQAPDLRRLRSLAPVPKFDLPPGRARPFEFPTCYRLEFELGSRLDDVLTPESEPAPG